MNNKNIIKTIIAIIIIIALVITLGVVIKLFINEKQSNTQNTQMTEKTHMPMEENKSKDTTADDVDAGKTVNSKEIDLSEYDSNLTISEAGTYTLSGSFKTQLW